MEEEGGGKERERKGEGEKRGGGGKEGEREGGGRGEKGE